MVVAHQKGGRSTSSPRMVRSISGSAAPPARGLHSSTFRLNVSAECRVGAAFWGYLGVVWWVCSVSEGVYKDA